MQEVFSPNSLGNKPLSYAIEAPLSQFPKNNLPLQILEGAWQGRLVYLPLVFSKPESQPYFLFHAIGMKGNLKGEEADKVAYHVNAYEKVHFAPQFSPNGQSVLFRVGDPFDTYGFAEAFVWDFTSAKLYNISYRQWHEERFEWSPDARYLAVSHAGYNVQSVWQRMQSTSPNQWSGISLLDIGLIRDRTAKGYPFKHQWISIEGARRPLMWTQQNTLLFTMPTGKPVFNSNPPSTSGEATVFTHVTEGDPRPCIAEVAPGGKPAKLIEQAYDPMPSPDNRFIAYFGWLPGAKPAPDQKPGVLPPPAFYLFERKSGRRFLISNSGAGQVMWSHQGQKLMLLETRATNQKRRYELNIMQWNLTDIIDGVATTPKAGRLVAILSASDK